MRSRRKQGQSGPRYRAHTSGPLKGKPLFRYNRRRHALRVATEIRCKLERLALAKRNVTGRLEEGAMLTYLRGIPPVAEIARQLLEGARVAKPRAGGKTSEVAHVG